MKNQEKMVKEHPPPTQKIIIIKIKDQPKMGENHKIGPVYMVSL